MVLPGKETLPHSCSSFTSHLILFPFSGSSLDLPEAVSVASSGLHSPLGIHRLNSGHSSCASLWAVVLLKCWEPSEGRFQNCLGHCCVPNLTQQTAQHRVLNKDLVKS